MNPKIKQLRDEYEANFKKIEALLGKGNDMTDQDFGEAKDLQEKNGKLGEQIKSLQAMAQSQSDANTFLNGLPAAPAVPHPGHGPGQLEGFAPAGKTYIDQRTNEMIQEGKLGLISEKQFQAISTGAYKQAFFNMIKAGGAHMLGMTDLKTIQEGIDDQGGFLVPAEVLAQLITKKPAPRSTLAAVRKMDTTRDRIQIPKVPYTTDNKYTTPVRVTWSGEVPASSTAHRATAPTFGLFEADIHTAMLSLPVTNDMIEDSMIGLMEYLQSAFAETVDFVAEDLIMNGTGIKQPHGILENPGGSNEPGTTVSGAAANITANGLKNLQYAVPPQYQMNSQWFMGWTNTAKSIEQLTDATGRYLWGEGVQQSGLSQSAYDRPLLSRPIAYNEFMPTIGASNYPIVYGDASGYYWVRRIGFSIQVLNEVYAEVNQKVLLGRLRVGGDVAEDWKLNIQKIST